MPPDTGRARGAMVAWQERVDEVAVRLIESDEALSDRRWRRPALAAGLGAGPMCVLEDHSEIPMAPPDSHTLEYRMAWLARSSDIVALADPRIPSFERHLARDLRLGDVEYIRPAAVPDSPLAERLARDDATLRVLAQRASAGGFTVVPYISTLTAWRLAERLAQMSGRQVRVAGPPPELTERVNNKLWFAQRARELIGPRAVPRTHVASDDRELKSHLRALASLGGRFVVKVPAGSGGRGIVTIDATSVVPDRIEAIVDAIRAQLTEGGWDGEYPLVVGCWDAPVVASPSVQIWVPHEQSGPPIIEAIFDQVLESVRFVGATMSTLSRRVQARLSADAMGLAMLFQRLGYFGRCSFDSVLVGDHADTATLHWLECNGRWGGVSTALSAIRRVIGPGSERQVVVVQSESPWPVQRTFEAVLELIGDAAFHRRDDRVGALVLSPRRVMAGEGLNLAYVAKSVAEAEDGVWRILRALSDPERNGC